MKRIQMDLTETADTCMMALSTTFDMMSVNPAACRLLGISSRPGKHYPLEKIFHPDSLGAANKLLKNISAGNHIKAHLTHKNGSPILCKVSALPLVSGSLGTIGIILSFKAMTKKGLQDSNSAPLKYMPRLNYQGVFDSLPEGVFTIDRKWQISSFNKTAEMLTGYTHREVIGKPCWQVFQSGSCEQQCPLVKVFHTGNPCEDQEISVTTQTGSSRKIIANASALRADDGSIVGGIKSFRLVPAKNRELDRFPDDGSFEGMIGNSKPMKAIFAMLRDVALSEAGVLISGESGTGKELVARAVHNLSHQHTGRFIAVNCSALPETLLESELFGHEKGAFTGASHLKPGRFELAEKGTLFIDEIGELKPSLQVKLLRVLEQREFERVGGSSTIRLNARIIAATNQNLERALCLGNFREDLYYRLRTIPVRLPPLRERTGDIPLLVEHFIKIFNQKYDKNVRLVDPKVMEFFMAHHWPGNIRELERSMEHAFVFVKGPIIFPRHLPEPDGFKTMRPDPPQKREAHDHDYLLWALDKTGGKRAETAKLLGLSRTSLWRKMKEAGIL